MTEDNQKSVITYIDSLRAGCGHHILYDRRGCSVLDENWYREKYRKLAVIGADIDEGGDND